MLFLSGSGELSVAFGNFLLPLLVAVRLVPLFRALFYSAVDIVVKGIRRPQAPILCPLFAPYLFPRRDHSVAEPGEKGVFFTY